MRDDALCDVCVAVSNEVFSDGGRQMCPDCFKEWFGESEVDVNKPETVN